MCWCGSVAEMLRGWDPGGGQKFVGKRTMRAPQPIFYLGGRSRPPPPRFYSGPRTPVPGPRRARKNPPRGGGAFFFKSLRNQKRENPCAPLGFFRKDRRRGTRGGSLAPDLADPIFLGGDQRVANESIAVAFHPPLCSVDFDLLKGWCG